MKVTILSNGLEYEVKKVMCTCTPGKSNYIRYYYENDETGTMIFGGSKEVIQKKIDKISKKEVITNIPFKAKRIVNNNITDSLESLPF